MITGQTLRDAILSGANNIANQRTRVDELNVFPVPDGDTGTNMSMTIGAARAELEAMPDSCTVAEASKTAASAMLRGARGNSGVITSLLFRGFSKALKDKTEASSADLAAALQQGVEAAYKAVMKPTDSFGVQNKQIDPVVSLCLGPCEISVGEMVSAYSAFANRGIRTAPVFVTRIEDNEGNVLANFTPQMDEVISETSAYKMLVMLRAVVNEGTGGRVRRLYGITADMGGKTGTTNRNSDGWFMGFTPSLVSGVWVGGEERDIHFDTMVDGQGAAMALPIWGLYMQKVYKDKSLGYSQDEKFNIPDDFDPCKDTLIDETSIFLIAREL